MAADDKLIVARDPTSTLSADVGDSTNKAIRVNVVAQGSTGGSSPAAPTSANVTAASSVVVAANTARTKMVIINTGSVSVYFGIGQAAVVGSGIMLTASGGTWVMDSGTFTLADIRAICASSSTLAIQEFS